VILSLVDECLNLEKQRGLSASSLKELNRYLYDFADYCAAKAVSVEDFTADFLRRYVTFRGDGFGPDLVKALVWSLRKFGGFLAFRKILPDNPAKPLRHPKMSPRRNLPQFLRDHELKTLLQSAARRSTLRDFAILSLLCSTGMRPSSAEALTRSGFDPANFLLVERLKGGGQKKTALNNAATAILIEYLASRNDDNPALFLTDRGKPVSKSWVQRMVKQAGEDAGLSTPLTCNQLRHTFAVHASERHGKETTKALLGHAKIATTSVYTHLSALRFRALMNRHPYNKEGGMR